MLFLRIPIKNVLAVLTLSIVIVRLPVFGELLILLNAVGVES